MSGGTPSSNKSSQSRAPSAARQRPVGGLIPLHGRRIMDWSLLRLSPLDPPQSVWFPLLLGPPGLRLLFLGL